MPGGPSYPYAIPLSHAFDTPPPSQADQAVPRQYSDPCATPPSASERLSPSPSHLQAKQCLEDHREELSGECRTEIDSMVERRVRDFRLDSRLKNACQDDIFTMCAYLGDIDSMDSSTPPSSTACR